MIEGKIRTVCEKDKCAGCMACVDICPKGAINIVDDLMAYNAIIDQEKCINCNACHRVCQNNYSSTTLEPIYWYQGWAENEVIRSDGSSGGLAGALSKYFIRSGGEVCSCCFKNGGFYFSFASTLDELKQFAGSKYVKSNPVGCYKNIKEKLKNDTKVLFIGLPCQVAAVKNYVGELAENNLYTVDLICHGTPSPTLLDIFLNQYNYSLKQMKDVRFRMKDKFQVYDGYRGVITNGVCDKYLIAFLNSLTYTENCYECQYARIRRVSDLTLGDSWGTEIGGNQRGKGISLVLCQTEKGHDLLKASELHLEQVDLERAIENNHQLSRPSVRPQGYSAFFTGIKRGIKFNQLVARTFPKQCLRQDIKRILIKLGLWGEIK
ncbi:MAG: Coenzyme F420 hydrogenase/dehydrogenase, beta subunit C-terminal domain [Lachnospiraceae bacterium]|nr:Coenzyme F420 hydrogenase/dehydrogenase, beta subunit C-terminal domain [Lachnospiraceae bacterium]